MGAAHARIRCHARRLLRRHNVRSLCLLYAIGTLLLCGCQPLIEVVRTDSGAVIPRDWSPDMLGPLPANAAELVDWNAIYVREPDAIDNTQYWIRFWPTGQYMQWTRFPGNYLDEVRRENGEALSSGSKGRYRLEGRTMEWERAGVPERAGWVRNRYRGEVLPNGNIRMALIDSLYGTPREDVTHILVKRRVGPMSGKADW